MIDDRIVEEVTYSMDTLTLYKHFFLRIINRAMSCPPGTVLNPRSLRCVRVTGKTARRLAQQGNIADYYGQQPYQGGIAGFFGRPQPQVRPRPYRADYIGRQQQQPLYYGQQQQQQQPYYYGQTQHRRTVRRPRIGIAAAFGVPAVRETQCIPGFDRNPTTGRCIKIGGKTHARLYPPVRPQPPVEELRRTSSEGPIRLPLGSAGVAPIADKPAILDWTRSQCRNDRDPIIGIQFAAAEAAALQDIVRLHDRTCVLSGPLNAKVAAEHKAGKIATVPGNSSDHMTLDDFRALRDSMRRHNPAYKIPGRKHQPPPANWQLYIASDNRSGPDFASILYVDIDKVIQGPRGPQYPVESVKLDLGFIPIKPTGAECSPQMAVDIIQQLARTNRLLTPVAGGWKPTAGFPHSKKYWSGSDPEVSERFSKLCRDLTKLLSSPL